MSLPAYTSPCRNLVLHPIYGNYHFDQAQSLVKARITEEAKPVQLTKAKSEPSPEVKENKQLSLIDIISSGDVKMVSETLKDIDIVLTTLELSPLHIASKAGNLDIVSYILSRSPDVNLADIEGETSLSKACFYGHDKVASLLLKNKADPKISDAAGWTALHNSASGGHLNCVKVLLDYLVDINVTNKDSFTALMCACSRGNVDMVEILLDNGACHTVVNGDGDSCIDIAIQNGHYHIARMIPRAKEGSINT